MKTIILTVVLLFAGAATAQDIPTPTLEQCRANHAVWHEADLNPLVYSALLYRGKTMSACGVVAAYQHGDAKTREDIEEGSKYSGLAHMYCLEIGARYASYLARHRETDKFLQEDKDGQRPLP
jgi:hypothetical protein